MITFLLYITFLSLNYVSLFYYLFIYISQCLIPGLFPSSIEQESNPRGDEPLWKTLVLLICKYSTNKCNLNTKNVLRVNNYCNIQIQSKHALEPGNKIHRF